MANYREPQWLLPNEKNLAMPASDATVGSGLAEDRHSLYSMKFDGTEYIDINPGSSSTIDLTSFTISAWVKWTNSGNSYGTAIRLSTTGDDIWIYLGRSTGFNFGVRFFLGSTALDDTDFLPTNEWKHIVVRYDESATSMKIYVDGQEKISTTANKNPSLWNTTSINQIGANGSGGEEMQGSISQVSIFDYALSTTEIAALSVANAPANVMALSSKPAAYYPLGEQARRGSEWQFPNEVLQSQVFDFNGTSEVIDINSTIDLGTVHTISFWANISATSFANIVTGTGGSAIKLNAATKIYYYTNNYTNSQPSISMPLNQWNNIVIARNGSTIKFYVNNSLLHTTSGFAGDSFTFNKILGLDVNNKLSNLAVWDTDESANIANIYNNGSPQSSYTTTPTAWYKLNATSNYAGLNPNWHNALSLGSTDYIDCGVISAVEGVSTFSMAAWVYPTNGAIKSVISNWGTPYIGVAIQTSSSAVYFVVDSDAAGSGYGASSSGLTNNTWNHVMLVFDGSGSTDSDKLKGYINGVEQSLSYTGTIVATTATPNRSFRIGDAHVGDGLIGNISNAAIWDQPISAEDVLYLYNGGTPQTNISFEPVSWWKLDNLTTGIQDSGSASNNGTNNGATEVTDSVAVDQWNFDNVSQAQTPNWSSALDFDGTNDYINIPYNANITPQTGNFTISAWINSDNLSGWHPIWSPLVLDSAVAAVALHTFDTNIRVTIGRPTSGWALLLDSTATLSTDTWYHIAVTFDFSGNAQIYINGQADNSAAIGTHSTSWSTADRAIGEGEGFWSGSISNLALFNTALDASAISTIYNSGQPETAISSSPVSWYKLDNTTTGIQDSGSASNNGTNNGATETQTNVWTPRLNGESTTLPSTALVSSDLQFESPYSNFSLDFDGTDDYVQVDNFESTNNIDTCSYSAWVNIDSSATGVRGIFGKGKSGANFEFNVRYYTAGTNLFIIQIDGTTVFENSSLSISTDAWHHIAVVIDRSLSAGSNIKLFVDGVEIANSVSVSFAQFTSTGYPLYIGAEADTSTSPRFEWYGNIDEVAIWNSALTQAQISQVYNNGYPADLTSLSPTSWWRLGEDAYFVSPNFTVPNQITGAPNGTSANMDQSDLVADAPGSYASGVGSSLALADRVGDAPESTANSLSFNMTPLNKISYPAGYAPTQVDNVYSIQFDGTNYITTGTTLTNLNISTSFSISCWVNITSNTNYYHIVGAPTSYAAWDTGFGLYTNGTGIRFWVDQWNGANQYVETASLSTGQWYHITATFDTTNGLKLYVNAGTPTTATGTSIDGLTNSIYLGSTGTNTTYAYIGFLDEVAIFDYALSARQIKQDIYNGTTTGKTADLNNISNLTAPVAWYRMGD